MVRYECCAQRPFEVLDNSRRGNESSRSPHCHSKALINAFLFCKESFLNFPFRIFLSLSLSLSLHHHLSFTPHPILTRNSGSDKANDDAPQKEGDLEEEEECEAQQPRNKSELYSMFNSKGPTLMVCGFMEDYELKAMAKIILEVAWPLENAFYKALEKLAEGWTAQCEWVADRALGRYLDTVVKILLAIEAESFHNWLGMTPSLRLDQGLPDADIPVWAKNEMKLLDLACDFSASLAEHVLWSHLQFWFAIPQVVAGILHKDPEKSELAVRQALRLAQVIVKAEGAQRPSALLQDLLQDLGWQKQQTPRECMALLLQNERAELKALAKRLYTGTPSTKDILENTFAFLHRKAALHVNSKMADATKYAYNIVSPYPETGGCPQILPDKVDYMSIHSPSGIPSRVWAHTHLFSPQKTLFPCPKAVPKPAQIMQSQFRSAGPLSQQRSAAAAAFLLADEDRNWQNLGCCWMGS